MSLQINPAAVNALTWESLLSPLGDVQKTDSVDGRTSFTITNKVGDETTTATISIPDDLELPETLNEGTLDDLVNKLADTGLGFTSEQVSQMKSSISALYSQTAAAVGEVNSQSTGSVLFDLYALMALMIDVAQSQRDASREMRTAENLAVQKSIQDQADQQRAAAMVGMIVGIVSGAATALVSIGTMVGQSVAAKTQSQIVAQSGADSAKMHSSMLQNTDNVQNAQAKLDQTAAKVGGEIENSVNAKFDQGLVDDQYGNLHDNFTAAKDNVDLKQQALDTKNGELQTAQDTLAQKQETLRQAESAAHDKQQYIVGEMNAGRQADPQRLAEFDARAASVDQARAEVTTAQNDVRIKQGEVTQATTELNTAKADFAKAKSDYVKTVQDVAAQYEEKYMTAVDRLANPPEGADKAQLQADVDTAKAEMEMAFAKEAHLLSQDNVMTPSEQKDMVASARARVDATMERVTQRMDFKAAERKMSTLMGINNINQAIGGVLQSTASNLAALQSAEATRAGAESKQEEEMLDQTKDLFQQEQKLIDQVIQLFSAVIQAENQSMHDAIQA